MFVADAGSLLDITEADPTIIRLTTTHIGVLRVPRPALATVGDGRAAELLRLGVTVHDCTVEQLMEAAAQPAHGLSFGERLCLITARDERYALVTHDTVLGRECADCVSTVVCALDLLLLLLRGKHITSEAAAGAAHALRRVNTKFMTGERFDACLKQISSF